VTPVEVATAAAGPWAAWWRRAIDVTREAIDALEAWHATTRELREATPWTSDWVRLRMIAQEQRAEYEALVEGEPEQADASDAVEEPVARS
jgi:hypothetical protein